MQYKYNYIIQLLPGLLKGREEKWRRMEKGSIGEHNKALSPCDCAYMIDISVTRDLRVFLLFFALSFRGLVPLTPCSLARHSPSPLSPPPLSYPPATTRGFKGNCSGFRWRVCSKNTVCPAICYIITGPPSPPDRLVVALLVLVRGNTYKDDIYIYIYNTIQHNTIDELTTNFDNGLVPFVPLPSRRK